MTKHKAIRASVTRNGYARDRTQVPELADKQRLRGEFGISRRALADDLGIARRDRGRRKRLAAEVIEQEERGRG
ncbi:hypothetical protein [Gordonia sp. NPDC003376]